MKKSQNEIDPLTPANGEGQKIEMYETLIWSLKLVLKFGISYFAKKVLNALGF